ncbi:Crp/Fnr family transcriptional regulator [Lysinibacillus sp. 54212]|uniref:Crp/Fnr family transcriptional regulator n=1 Tax=Lysinibacillus sp. 54212 TaxID=3119829 RepID=UPI002FCABA9D
MDKNDAINIWGYPFSNRIKEKLELRIMKRGERILGAGEPIDGLYLLVEGRYYVTTQEVTGKELLLRYCHPPAILGDIEIFQSCPVQSDCIADRECTFLWIPLAVYRNDLQQDAAFCQLLLKELSFKLQTCTVSSRVNALSSVATRLAAYLCTIATDENYTHYMSTTNLTDIASLIGTTKRHLNRVLKDWVELNIVERSEEGISILDWQQIEGISEGIRYE